MGSPPLARGILDLAVLNKAEVGITPACAGNTVSMLSICTTSRDHPRLRGEYLRRCGPGTMVSGSPPLARGILCPEPSVVCMAGITPACAGNTSCMRLQSKPHRDHPRLRGEYFTNPNNRIAPLGSPPLARGIRGEEIAGWLTNGITPACAGNTLIIRDILVRRPDHPRLRGEYAIPTALFAARLGSPPLARGILYNGHSNSFYVGITPACAGNTGGFHPWSAAFRDHPRLRGEYRLPQALSHSGEGSPPLARGILGYAVTCTADSGITPACAGNTSACLPWVGSSRDHPRLRGEYLVSDRFTHAGAGSPPLARGILKSSHDSLLLLGITPACAGNTLQDRQYQSRTQDHPRLRGEYAFRLFSMYNALGSPPLARGIRRLCIRNSFVCGITPACAGNT